MTPIHCHVQFPRREAARGSEALSQSPPLRCLVLPSFLPSTLFQKKIPDLPSIPSPDDPIPSEPRIPADRPPLRSALGVLYTTILERISSGGGRKGNVIPLIDATGFPPGYGLLLLLRFPRRCATEPQGRWW